MKYFCVITFVARFVEATSLRSGMGTGVQPQNHNPLSLFPRTPPGPRRSQRILERQNTHRSTDAHSASSSQLPNRARSQERSPRVDQNSGGVRTRSQARHQAQRERSNQATMSKAESLPKTQPVSMVVSTRGVAYAAQWGPGQAHTPYTPLPDGGQRRFTDPHRLKVNVQLDTQADTVVHADVYGRKTSASVYRTQDSSSGRVSSWSNSRGRRTKDANQANGRSEAILSESHKGEIPTSTSASLHSSGMMTLKASNSPSRSSSPPREHGKQPSNFPFRPY